MLRMTAPGLASAKARGSRRTLSGMAKAASGAAVTTRSISLFSLFKAVSDRRGVMRLTALRYARTAVMGR